MSVSKAALRKRRMWMGRSLTVCTDCFSAMDRTGTDHIGYGGIGENGVGRQLFFQGF